jgi:recombination protein RecA
MSQALRKLTPIVNRSKTCVVFINQLREKVGIMFGNPEVTPGGKALKFYASIRIDVRRGELLKDAEGAAGNRTKAKIVKNKLAPPFRQAEFDIIYGEGISQEGCLIDLGVQYDVLKKSGAWYSYNDAKVANGKDKMRKFLKDNPELAAEIEARIREAAKGNPQIAMEASDDNGEKESE